MTFWITCPPLATMTTSTRAAASGTNSTRSNTAASCAGPIANPTCCDACDTTCDACGSTTSASGAIVSRRSRASTSAGGPVPALRIEQQIDVEAIAAVGRDSAGRGVRLLDEAFCLPAAPGCCGRSPTRRPARQRRTSTDEATGSPEAMYSRTSAPGPVLSVQMLPLAL